MNQINDETRELILQLLDDTLTLEKQLKYSVPSPSESRAVLIPILRKWINDDNFFHIQKLIEKSKHPLFTINKDDGPTLCEDGYYERWMGLIIFNNIGIATAQVAKKYIKNGEVKASKRSQNATIKAIPQRASIFFDQKIMFWKNNFYTRRNFIKWHANKLGGVHYDFERKTDEAHINEIKNTFGFEVKGNNYQMLVGNDIEIARADIQRRQYIYDTTELVAIDTARIFMEGINKAKSDILALLSLPNAA